MNIILFMFITMASAFIASSANNVSTINTALDDYFTMANSPDHMLLLSENEASHVETFVTDEQIPYWKQEMWSITKDQLLVNGNIGSYGNLMSVTTISSDFHVFDQQDQILTDVEDGTIYLSASAASTLGLNKGDQITLKNGEISKTFTFHDEIKDALFGTSMTGMIRMVISEHDYESLTQSSASKIYCYGLFSNDEAELVQMVEQEEFQAILGASKSTLRMTYLVDLIIAGILVVISICLILISMLILRFTIQFTMSEEVREIGVMKAIGIRNSQIRYLYLVKYLAITLAGCSLGFLLSIPLGAWMITSISNNMIIQQHTNVIINVISVIGIMAVTMIFGAACTKSIGTLSVIDAIRKGERGERYHRKGVLRLPSCKCSAILFIAMNDITCNFRRYVVMVLIFTMGLLLNIIPANAINTLQSDESQVLFNMAPSDLVMQEQGLVKVGEQKVPDQQYIDTMKKTLQEHGVYADVFVEVGYQVNVSFEGKKSATMAFQGVGDVTSDAYTYLQGTPPQNKQEVALSYVNAKRLGAGIGDTICVNFGHVKRDYIVSAIYQTMNNMGIALRFFEGEALDMLEPMGSLGVQIKYQVQQSQEQKNQNVESLMALYPDYEIGTPGEYVDRMIGNVAEQLSGMNFLVMVIVLSINSLVIILMVKSFITHELGELAMLKAIGFRSTHLMLIQVLRILIIMSISIVLALCIQQFMTDLSVGMIFEMMGAVEMTYAIDVVEVYVVIPMVMFLVSGCACAIISLGIRRISPTEIAVLE